MTIPFSIDESIIRRLEVRIIEQDGLDLTELLLLVLPNNTIIYICARFRPTNTSRSSKSSPPSRSIVVLASTASILGPLPFGEP